MLYVYSPALKYILMTIGLFLHSMERSCLDLLQRNLPNENQRSCFLFDHSCSMAVNSKSPKPPLPMNTSKQYSSPSLERHHICSRTWEEVFSFCGQAVWLSCVYQSGSSCLRLKVDHLKRWTRSLGRHMRVLVMCSRK